MNYWLCVFHFLVKKSLHWSSHAYINCSTFYPLSDIQLWLCQASLSPSLTHTFVALATPPPPTPPTHTHTHAHTHAHNPHTHTHTQWVTLAPWGRTMFNCSSALSLVLCRQGIKGEQEWERNEEGGREVAPGGREERRGEERKPRHVLNCCRSRWTNIQANAFSDLINSSMMSIQRISPVASWLIVLYV